MDALCKEAKLQFPEANYSFLTEEPEAVTSSTEMMYEIEASFFHAWENEKLRSFLIQKWGW